MCQSAKEQLLAFFTDADGSWRSGQAMTHKTRLPVAGKHAGLDAIMKFHGLTWAQCNSRLAAYKMSKKLVADFTALDVSEDAIRANVDDEDIEDLLKECQRRLTCSLFIEFHPGMDLLLTACCTKGVVEDDALVSFWEGRLNGLVELHVQHFPRTKNQLNSKRLAFEGQRRITQNTDLHSRFLAEIDRLTLGRSEAGSVGILPEEYRAPAPSHQVLRSFCTNLDDMLYDVWIKCIRESTLAPFVIPRDSSALDTRLHDVVYYIASSCGSKYRKRSRQLDTAGVDYYASWIEFVKKNFIAADIARDLELPTDLVDRRNRRSLMYACPRFFNFVKIVEATFCTNLSLEALALHGGTIVGDLFQRLKETEHIRVLFDECLVGTGCERATDQDEVTQAWDDMFEYTLRYYLRMRGKDFTKTVNDATRVKAAGDSATTRVSVQVAFNLAKEKGEKERKVADSAAAVSGGDEESESDSDEEALDASGLPAISAEYAIPLRLSV